MIKFKLYFSRLFFMLLLTSSYDLKSEIIDQNSILTQSDIFLNANNFEDSFNINDSVKIQSIECLANTCQNPIENKAIVEKDLAGNLFINIYTKADKKTSAEQITEYFWESINRNFFRAKLKKIESFGFQISILESTFIDCPAHYFLSSTQQCLQIKLKAISKTKLHSEYIFILSNSNVGLGQILEYTQSDFLFQNIRRDLKYFYSNITRIN